MWTSDLNQPVCKEFLSYKISELLKDEKTLIFLLKALERVVANMIRQLAKHRSTRKNNESAVPANYSSSRSSSRPAFSMSVDQPPAPGDQCSAAAVQPTISITRRRRK